MLIYPFGRILFVNSLIQRPKARVWRQFDILSWIKLWSALMKKEMWMVMVDEQKSY